MRATTTVIILAILMAAPLAAAGFGIESLNAPAPAPANAADPVVPYAFRNWVTGTEELQRLAKENPDVARLHSIGKSVRGLDLWVMEITNFQSNDPPLESRPVMWFDGNTHGNEQLGGELAFEVVNFLLTERETNDTADWLVKNRRVFVLPIVNPDGNLQDSRFNGRGVNINRNWPTGWGGVGTGIGGNDPGAYPASEPETTAIIRFIEAMPQKPDYFQSFHTGIVLWLYPWGYKEDLPADEQMFRRTCEEAFPGDERCGPTYTTIYPASGIAVDWGYDAFGASSWTYEVSDTQFDPASLVPIRDQLSEAWQGTMHALVNIEKYGAHLVLDGLRITPLDGGRHEVRATVLNDGYGDLEWADIGLAVAGSRAPTGMRIANLAAGETREITVVVERVEPVVNGTLDVHLTYPKRVWRQPMANDVIVLPLAPGAGLALAEGVLDDLSVTYGDLVGENLLPAPGVGFLVGMLVALGVVLRRRR